MPGKMVQCTICSKNMRSDNLRRHARSCKRANSCCRDDKSLDGGLILDYISGAEDHHKTERVSNTDSSDEEITSSEAKYSESSNGDDDAICSDVDHIGLWERLAIICIIDNNSKFKQMNICKGYVLIYMQSESDELFNEIMDDIMDAKLRRVPLRDAVSYALKENEESVIASVEICPSDESVWCQLAEMGGN